MCAELSSTQETNLTLSDKLVEMEAATRDREEEQSKQISVLEDLRTDQQLKEKQMKEATSEYENKIVQLTEKCRVSSYTVYCAPCVGVGVGVGVGVTCCTYSCIVCISYILFSCVAAEILCTVFSAVAHLDRI